jgi:hypothetical protein
MAQSSEPRKVELVSQPGLSHLLSGYLQRQAEAQALGLATFDATAEVVPYEAGPVQPVDARLAWEEAVAALRLFEPAAPARSWQAPPSWPSLVAGHESVAALPLSVGNFPQLVRDLHPLLQATDLRLLCPTAPRHLVAVPGLSEWATQVAHQNALPQTLLAVGVLRLAKHFDQADNLLQDQEASVPTAWRPAWANEQAALAWQRGQADEARTLWNAQPDRVPVHFNRGMAALFLGNTALAGANVARATAGLPEDSAWYHLGRLYLALAESF